MAATQKKTFSKIFYFISFIFLIGTFSFANEISDSQFSAREPVCEVEVPINAGSADEYNSKVESIDMKLRNLQVSYYGYYADSLEKGNYTIFVEFGLACSIVHGRLISILSD